MNTKKALQLFEELQKMDPALARALANIRAGRATPNDANVVARGIYTDTMVPKMGNKLAYQDHITRNGNQGFHVHADLNDFGQVNKKHGEKEGDNAIRKFGEISNEVSRLFGGKSFRNGGDEFKFWFHKPEQAHGFARELRSRLEKHPKIGGTHNLAASIGIGFNPDHAESALLEAKKQLGATDMTTGKRVNMHSVGNAPTVIHSKTHEPAPAGWKAPGAPAEPKKTTQNLAPPGLKFNNPLEKTEDDLAKASQAVNELRRRHTYLEYLLTVAPPEQHEGIRGQQKQLLDAIAHLETKAPETYLRHNAKAVRGFQGTNYRGNTQVVNRPAIQHAPLRSQPAVRPITPKEVASEGRNLPDIAPTGGPGWKDRQIKKDEGAITKPIPGQHPVAHGGRFGIITAENPFHPVTTPGGNDALEKELKARGLKYEKIQGKYSNDNPENGFMVHGIEPKDLMDLGRRYGQDSVLHSHHGEHKLIYTNGPNAGKYNPGSGHVIHSRAPEMYYSTVRHAGKPLHFTLNLDFDRLESMA